MAPQGYQSYFSTTEEGTQLGTEANVWGREGDLFESFQYFDTESMASADEQKFLTEIGRNGTQDRAVKRHRLMGRKCEGSVTFVVYPEGGGDKSGIGQLIKHAFGDIATGTFSGDGTSLHTFTPHDDLFGNLAASTGTGAGTGKVFGLSVHIGREDTAGTIRNYPYLGCRIRSLNFVCTAGEELKCTVDFVGRVAKAHAAAKTPTFPTMEPFLWKDATFQIGVDEAGAGGTVQTIDSFNITIANNFTEMWTLGTNVLGRVIPNGQRLVTGSFSAPFETWVRAEHQKWKDGTSSAMNISFVSGPFLLEFRCANIYYTGTAPSIGGMEENIVEMPFQALLGTAFDIRVFLTNTDLNVGYVIA